MCRSAQVQEACSGNEELELRSDFPGMQNWIPNNISGQLGTTIKFSNAEPQQESEARLSEVRSRRQIFPKGRAKLNFSKSKGHAGSGSDPEIFIGTVLQNSPLYKTVGKRDGRLWQARVCALLSAVVSSVESPKAELRNFLAQMLLPTSKGKRAELIYILLLCFYTEVSIFCALE